MSVTRSPVDTTTPVRAWQAHSMLGTRGRFGRVDDTAEGGRVSRWLDRVEGSVAAVVKRLDRHPMVADAALVGVLAVVTLPDAVGHDAGVVALLLHLGLWLPVVFRRRAPSPVFAVLVVVALVQWLIGVELAADLALLVGLYTVAAHRGRVEALSAAVVLEVGVVLAAVRWGEEDGTARTFVQLTGVVIAAFLSGTTVRSRTAGFALLQERADRLERERDQQAAIAAAAERTRIAREMHDIVAHSLSVMVTLADGAALTNRPDDARDAMRQVSRTGRDALADTRRVLDVLRDDAAVATRQPAPTVDTIPSLLTAVRSTGLDVEMLVEGVVFAVTATAQTALYRIVQEALTNTVKHAAASRARVTVRYAEPGVWVTVVDDGTAGRAAPAGQPVGHGLTGMRERAALFGGTVDAGPRPDGGWRVEASLPRVGGPTG